MSITFPYMFDPIKLGFKINDYHNKVFVYIVDMDICIPNTSDFWRCLSLEEKTQAESYYSKLLAERYIISHGIYRYILSNYTQQLPQNINFIKNNYGKAFLKDNNNIQFNLSHSYNIASYIVAFNCLVGVDIEYHNYDLDFVDLIEQVLTVEEIILFNSLSEQEKYKIFYELWTKKESLVKALGIGLSYPVNTVQCMTQQASNNIMLTNINILSRTFYSYSLKFSDNYAGAIATEKNIKKVGYITSVTDHIPCCKSIIIYSLIP